MNNKNNQNNKVAEIFFVYPSRDLWFASTTFNSKLIINKFLRYSNSNQNLEVRLSKTLQNQKRNNNNDNKE